MGMKDFTGNSGNSVTNGQPPSGGGMGIPAGIPGLEEPSIDPKELLINYNDEFRNAQPTLFRDEIVQQVLGVLIGKNKPNAMLVGPPGTGKTRIAEEIARRIAVGDGLIPDKLADMVVYELPLSSIVSGSSLVGQLEEKAKAVIDFAEDPANKAILFIDEIHQLVSSTSPTYQKIAQIMKPALARGKMRVIGATTTQEAKDMMDDPAFNRRFSRVIVDELTKQQTVEILIAAKPGFLQHHNFKVAVNDDTMATVVELAEQYKPAGSHRPDNALTLIDRAIGDAVVARKRQETLLAADPSQATALQALKAIKQIPVTERQIRQTAIKLATGNSKPETLDVDKLREALSVIKGQDDIVDHLILELRKHELNLMPTNQPLTMLFIGPSGVGKTEVTKIVAKELTGCPPIVLNMTEYNSSASVNRIIGSAAGYVGSDSHAELPFDALESNPYQIILLDEFEKCDEAVKKLFMQVFDEGYLKTNRGNVVDFSKSIIIATTNAGHTEMKSNLGFSPENTARKRKTAVRELSAFFDIALLNRFKDQITFGEIGRDVYREIIKSKYTANVAAIRTGRRGVVLPDEIPDDVLDGIVETTYVPEFGARPARKAVEDFIYGEIL